MAERAGKRALKIDARARTVRVIEVRSLDDMQAAVGGLIEPAFGLPNGDEVYVDEEGLLKPLEVGFAHPAGHHPFYVGDGLVLGRLDARGSSTAAVSSAAELMGELGWVVFIDRAP